ncbi:SspB family protein [Sneathiella limimaris]|uniref:SspB family protein n=1 Tax=Sneathiella limimaris TaxID=1964213 RepID=UPI00146B4B28|nr:ClpXP protease specificity-enhancing factor SspB [Sneathiella limimaris]
MAGDLNYNLLVERALLSVVRESLNHAAAHGLSGQQHFYITFKTRFPGVVIPDHLRERYSDDMTIVLQHQFWDLEVTDEGFSIGLSFNHQKETLVIPFASITAFADPSEQFGLQFTVSTPAAELDATDSSDEEAKAASADTTDTDSEENKAGEVITLDAFRKKQ